jgi:CRP/FNR family cyclic AMP-dependent transcriptional regulator
LVASLQEAAWAARYRKKQNIYTQGAPADTLFYIQKGAVWLTTRTKHQPSAVTAALRVNDFFGVLCLAGYPLRMSTAVALTASSIRTIKKEKMLQTLRKKNKKSNSLVVYLLSSVKNYRDQLLTSSAEQRLAMGISTAALGFLSECANLRSIGGNGRDHAHASQSIQEARIHKL